MSNTISEDYDNDICELGEFGFSDVFTTGPEVLFLGIAVAVFLAAPALSVFFRKTEQRPLPSYKYSCIVKFMAGFMGMSSLVGDLYHSFTTKKNCSFPLWRVDTLPIYAALITEMVEFLFDFGRLVIFWSDPGEIDFYQNVRWNVLNQQQRMTSSTSISAIPMIILIFVMFIFVSLANYNFLLEWLDDCEESSENSWNATGYDDDCGPKEDFVMTSALFATISTSVLGAYYLLRMICSCSANEGEKKGIGFFWSRWKLIAVDLPSICVALSKSFSGVGLFWTMETFNDLFPLISVTLIGLWLNRGLREDNRRFRNSFNVDLQDKPTPTLTALIRVKKRKNPGRYFSFHIDRTVPKIVRDEMSDSEWIEFCEKVDFALQPFGGARDTSRLKSKIKTGLILCALISSMLYWYLMIEFVEIRVHLGHIILLAFSFILGTVFCCKACHRRDHVTEEGEAFNDLVAVCDAQSNLHPNIQLFVHVEDDAVPYIKAFKWIFWKGFSWKAPFTSIRHIECRIRESENNNRNNEATILAAFPVTIQSEV